MKYMQVAAGVRVKANAGVERLGWGVVLLALMLGMMGLPLKAQAQSGGVESIFALGAGARSMGLGSATVAMPVDATTLYWNPAGLDLLQRKNMALFYAPLPMPDAKYNFLGYAHPSLRVGTFGIGWIHADAGEIELRPDPDLPIMTGVSTYSQDEILISYAKEFPFALAVGASIKYERQAFSAIDLSASGVGFDLGLIYRPQLGEGVWQDFSVGVAVQNLIEPRLKLDNQTDAFPRTIRAGIAKPVRFGAGTDVMNLFFNFKAGVKGASSRMQFGSEYIYQERATVRLGFNGEDLSYGAGVMYQNFAIDYAWANYSKDSKSVDGLPMQHRVSITMQLGKTKTELLEAERRKQQEREENQVKRQLHLQNQADFAKAMEDGNEYFKRGDFYQALLRYSGASRIFPGDEDARVWVGKAQDKYDEEQRRREEELKRISAARKAREVDSLFVEAQINNGMRYLEAGDFREAVREWQTGANRAANYPRLQVRLQELISKTQSELGNRITDLLKRARSMEAQGRVSEAVELYNRALSDGSLSAGQKTEISNLVAKLQTQLNVKDLVAQGVTAYNSRDYRAAVSYFQEVLKTDAGNPRARQYIFDAESRLNAKPKEFASERLRQRFTEAVRLSQSGNYAAALKILEEIQTEDRYNKYILDAIDQARDKLNRK